MWRRTALVQCLILSQPHSLLAWTIFLHIDFATCQMSKKWDVLGSHSLIHFAMDLCRSETKFAMVNPACFRKWKHFLAPWSSMSLLFFTWFACNQKDIEIQLPFEILMQKYVMYYTLGPVFTLASTCNPLLHCCPVLPWAKHKGLWDAQKTTFNNDTLFISWNLYVSTNLICHTFTYLPAYQAHCCH